MSATGTSPRPCQRTAGMTAAGPGTCPHGDLLPFPNSERKKYRDRYLTALSTVIKNLSTKI